MEGLEPHFIEDEEVIDKILKNLELWEMKALTPPRAKGGGRNDLLDDSESHVPFSAPPFYPDPEYPMDYNRISELRWVTQTVTVSATGLAFFEVQKLMV